MPTSSIDSPFWDFFGKFIMDNPCVYTFEENPEITKTPDVSTWWRGRWAKDPPSTTPRRAKSGQRPPPKGRVSPRGAPSRGRTTIRSGIILYTSFAHSNANVITSVYNRQIQSRARSISLQRSLKRHFFRAR